LLAQAAVTSASPIYIGGDGQPAELEAETLRTLDAFAALAGDHR
jgi:hypothetical protein